MRRAFTLMETMLATSLAGIVVLACVVFMYSMNRTDRMLEVRAEQRASLGRVRTVMHRTFSSLLMSDEQRPVMPGEDGVNVRPVSQPAARPNADTPGVPGEDEEPPLPPPPRVMLGMDPYAVGTFQYRAPTGEIIEAVPQRLEVVLHRSPVPQAVIDPMDMPLPRRSSRRRAPVQDEPAGATELPRPDEALQDGELEPEEEVSLPVRAIRGVFELHPQPPSGIRPPGVPLLPVEASPSDERTGLWELWWVPLPPAEPEDDEDPRDRTVSRNERIYAQIGRPTFIAGDLKYAYWTAFFERAKVMQLVSTWQGDLPAYIELHVETAAGIESNWMFEVDWANGAEVFKEPQVTPNATASKANPAGTPAAGSGAPGADRPAAGAGARPGTTRPGSPSRGRPSRTGGSGGGRPAPALTPNSGGGKGS